MDNKGNEFEKKHLLETREVIKNDLSLNMEDVNVREDQIYEINNYVWKNLSSLNADVDPLEQKFLENEALDKHNLVLMNIYPHSILINLNHCIFPLFY